ncbi:uncharacterized protein N7477_003296 [Penicillium maclennaniae]|uniref:uncharacterized protein n=1 Tax=Penicillium maclennaniae TaxID=1343394 RepID=UPI0025418C03|nr:uncharacterized protein N7477_003296 [Penicillium maclennaniae]KAJ5677663.1 hypothetical protein N7477_003296 [Penicillium maclennaniae]
MAEARLLAYQTDSIYRLYNIKTKKIVISRDIIFQELPPTDLPKPSYDLDAIHKPSPDQAMNMDEMERQRRRFAPAKFLPFADDYYTDQTFDIDRIEGFADHQDDEFIDYTDTFRRNKARYSPPASPRDRPSSAPELNPYLPPISDSLFRHL